MLRKLLHQIDSFLIGKSCGVFPAPFAVRLPGKDEDDTEKIFQPDIVVVCDGSKIDKRGCKGAPGFIIEILSPSTAVNDMFYKLNIYNNAGVKEYWIVDPIKKLAGTYLLKNKKYRYTAFDAGITAELPVSVLPGCVIDLKTVFG